jgi:hypothetical protein
MHMHERGILILGYEIFALSEPALNVRVLLVVVAARAGPLDIGPDVADGFPDMAVII